jgi:hypothetical protein
MSNIYLTMKNAMRLFVNFFWPDGMCCPKFRSGVITKRGFHTHQVHPQRYEFQDCGQQFDDLSGTIFEGHHQPL